MNTTICEHRLTNTLNLCPYVCVQAWAFASGARRVLGLSTVMNLENFPCDVWYAHRKLFHRFMKYKKYVVKATSAIPEMKEMEEEKVKKEDSSPSEVPASQHVISLLTDSEGEVSSDSDTDVEADVEGLFTMTTSESEASESEASESEA